MAGEGSTASRVRVAIQEVASQDGSFDVIGIFAEDCSNEMVTMVSSRGVTEFRVFGQRGDSSWVAPQLVNLIESATAALEEVKKR